MRAHELDGVAHRLVVAERRSAAEKESYRTYDIKLVKKDIRRVLKGEDVLLCDPYWGAERVKGKRFVKPGPFQSAINEEGFYTKRRVRSASWLLWLSKTPFD